MTADWWPAKCRLRTRPSVDLAASLPISNSRQDCSAAASMPRPTVALAAASLPRGQYGSTLISLPAPGTENDDTNPPRVAPRNLFDLAVGDDNLFHGERYKWSLTLTAINLTNKVALYNFLSTFSGTHYVTPRALTAEIGFHF